MDTSGGFTIIPHWVIDNLSMSPDHFLMFCIIARKTWGTSATSAAIPNPEMKAFLRCSLNHMLKVRDELESLGYIHVQKTNGGCNSKTVYSIAVNSSPSEPLSNGTVHAMNPNSSLCEPAILNKSLNKNNIPPISPQGGQGVQQSSHVTVEPTASQSEATASEAVKPKRNAKAHAEPINPAELDINNLANPLPFQADWMQDERMKAAFREVLAEYQITDKETLIRIWKLLKGEFVTYWTGLNPKSARAKKKCWIDTFRNHVRRQAEQNAWRWKKNESFLGGDKPETAKLTIPTDIDPNTQGAQFQRWAMSHGFRGPIGKETIFDYVQAVRAWVREQNGVKS